MIFLAHLPHTYVPVSSTPLYRGESVLEFMSPILTKYLDFIEMSW
jgi:hypothetical protein